MAPIHVASTAKIEVLKDALKASSDQAHKTRIRAIIKLQEGKTKTAVANELMVGRTSLIEWVKRYNTGGIPALALSKGGRKEGNPKWSATSAILCPRLTMSPALTCMSDEWA